MSKAEQVFESFVSGNETHFESPLLNIDNGILRQCLSAHRVLKRRRVHTGVAVMLGEALLYKNLDRGASQLLLMIERRGRKGLRAMEVTDTDFTNIAHVILMLRGQQKAERGLFWYHKRITGVPETAAMHEAYLTALSKYRLDDPYPIKDTPAYLRYLNRTHYGNAYESAVLNVGSDYIFNLDERDPTLPQYTVFYDQRAYMNGGPLSQACDHWTFFKDLTDATIARLQSRHVRTELVTLRPTGS